MRAQLLVPTSLLAASGIIEMRSEPVLRPLRGRACAICRAVAFGLGAAERWAFVSGA